MANRGWRVALAGLGINLALGILYSWSVISKGVPADWNWSQADRSWPYAVACLVFCLVMVPAGRLQDQIGPRSVAAIGGVLLGVGMILASQTTTPLGYILGFGVLAGAGIGFGYASATPPAVKWFAADRTGMVAGVVVSGFGLASVYTAPLTSWLIRQYGLSTSVMVLGIGFSLAVVLLAQLLEPPPPGYVAGRAKPKSDPSAGSKKEEYYPREMLRTWQFYCLWFMFACAAGAGLMIISQLAKIASAQAGLELGFILVAALAVGNGAGRIVAGLTSDKLGRLLTLRCCMLAQAALILLLSRSTADSALANSGVMTAISALIGANYGANLALFPAVTKDYFGLRHFGMNYGLVFTAWGLGGFALSLLAGKVYDATQTFNFAYYASAILLAASASATFVVRPPHDEERPSIAGA